jgi:hypothetical protein
MEARGCHHAIYKQHRVKVVMQINSDKLKTEAQRAAKNSKGFLKHGAPELMEYHGEKFFKKYLLPSVLSLFAP